MALDLERIRRLAADPAPYTPMREEVVRATAALLSPSPRTLVISTASYRSWTPDLGTPVKTSNSRPRWKLPYELTVSSRVLTPPWEWVRADLPPAEFAARYRDHLDDLGVRGVTAHVQELAELAGDCRLCLLCFEDLTKPRVTCHRTVFAAWWRQKTGRPVTEQA